MVMPSSSTSIIIIIIFIRNTIIHLQNGTVEIQQ